ncbi:MAG: hypothetical protein AAFR62_21565 [Cyanobacteria bacterium J06629_2]
MRSAICIKSLNRVTEIGELPKIWSGANLQVAGAQSDIKEIYDFRLR